MFEFIYFLFGFGTLRALKLSGTSHVRLLFVTSQRYALMVYLSFVLNDKSKCEAQIKWVP